MDLGGGECSSEEHHSFIDSINISYQHGNSCYMETGMSSIFVFECFQVFSVCALCFGLFRVISGFLPGQNFLGVCCLWGMCMGFFSAFLWLVGCFCFCGFICLFIFKFLTSASRFFSGFFNNKSYSLIHSSVREKSVAGEHKVCAAGLLVSIINFVMLQLRDFVPDAGVQPDGLSGSGFKVLLVF